MDAKWFSAERFTYVGPYKKPYGCWPHLSQHLNGWLNRYVLPELLERNRHRVERAIPAPPIFDAKRIIDSLWVLESTKEALQGTAFHLTGVGLITNQHLLASDTHAFRAEDSPKKYPVKIMSEHRDIDLAIVKIPSSLGCRLRSDPLII